MWSTSVLWCGVRYMADDPQRTRSQHARGSGGSSRGANRRAQLLGQLIDAFGVDRVLWGTDTIWYGSPPWQIEAFRRFHIPDRLREEHGYHPLTRAVKEKIFGLNAAALFGVDVEAKRKEVSPGLPEPDQDGVSGGGGRAEPSVVWLGGWIVAGLGRVGGHGMMAQPVLLSAPVRPH